MKLQEITSPANPIVKRVRLLAQRSGREKTGQFLLEGTRLIAEALAKKVHLESILVSQSFLKNGSGLNELNLQQLHVVDDRLFNELSTQTSPVGILAVAAIPELDFAQAFKPAAPLILVAEAIQDPGNLGTILRSALAASCSGVIATRGTVDLYNPKVVRAAAGALFALPVLTDVATPRVFEILQEHEVKVVVLDVHATRAYWECDLTGATALVVGNEGQGLSEIALSGAHERVTIPMHPASESLNAALSSSIVMFEAVRQRKSAAGQTR